jgi:hypothetical protein
MILSFDNVIVEDDEVRLVCRLCNTALVGLVKKSLKVSEMMDFILTTSLYKAGTCKQCLEIKHTELASGSIH